ncbi:MAG: 50S ribosomal protein L17, partial [Flavobacteriales bacterium]
ADMAIIELVDFNEIYNVGKPKAKKTTRRGKSKKVEAAPAAETETETKAPAADAENKADESEK